MVLAYSRLLRRWRAKRPGSGAALAERAVTHLRMASRCSSVGLTLALAGGIYLVSTMWATVVQKAGSPFSSALAAASSLKARSMPPAAEAPAWHLMQVASMAALAA